jgi:hypothetical protein
MPIDCAKSFCHQYRLTRPIPAVTQKRCLPLKSAARFQSFRRMTTHDGRCGLLFWGAVSAEWEHTASESAIAATFEQHPALQSSRPIAIKDRSETNEEN